MRHLMVLLTALFLALSVGVGCSTRQRISMETAAAKALVEIKRGMEARFCSDQDSQPDDGTQPYQTRGLGTWINASASTDLPVDSRYLTPAASIDTTVSTSVTDSTSSVMAPSPAPKSSRRVTGRGERASIALLDEYAIHSLIAG